MRSNADGETAEKTTRSLRADGQRNLDALLQAARDLFVADGVDTPIRTIAAKAGLGVGTVYRHFPQRSDLIAAVFRREIDDCADAAEELTRLHDPVEALQLWMLRFSAFFSTKKGLAGALHSGEPAYQTLPNHFEARLRPTLERLLASAADTGRIRSDVASSELLGAVARLSMSDNGDLAQAQRMVALLGRGLLI